MSQCRKSVTTPKRTWRCAHDAAEGKTMCAHHVKQEKFKRDHYRARRERTLATLTERVTRAEALLAQVAELAALKEVGIVGRIQNLLRANV